VAADLGPLSSLHHDLSTRGSFKSSNYAVIARTAIFLSASEQFNR
jgi:hypothetical protein